jgi:hypothetical protein
MNAEHAAAQAEAWATEAEAWAAEAHRLRREGEYFCTMAGRRFDEANGANDKADEAEAQVMAWRATADGAA